MRERSVEAYLLHRVKEVGGLCLKFVSPGMSGVPDRLVLYRAGAFFVEVKKKGLKPEPLQIEVHKIIKAQGLEVWVVDDRDSINKFISYLQYGISI